MRLLCAGVNVEYQKYEDDGDVICVDCGAEDGVDTVWHLWRELKLAEKKYSLEVQIKA